MNFGFRRNKQKEKIFCIGRNKTGTTSLEAALREFGYKMGDQQKAERLIKNYKNYYWKPIIKFCESADAFQDAPFSLPYTWLILAHYFPKSKFILTTRDEEDWYRSLTQYHSKLFSDGVKIPDINDLKNATYNYEGFVWEANRAVYKTPEDDLYNKELLIEQYRAHNTSILNYFKGKNNFLHIDIISDKDAYKKLVSFLNEKLLHSHFPHLNKTNF